jgi:hypothetical protein
MKKRSGRTWVFVRVRDRWKTSFLVQRQVGPGHVRRSAYDTPEEALALTTMGVTGLHIIGPSDHVFTPHRDAKQVRRLKERRQLLPVRQTS